MWWKFSVRWALLMGSLTLSVGMARGQTPVPVPVPIPDAAPMYPAPGSLPAGPPNMAPAPYPPPLAAPGVAVPANLPPYLQRRQRRHDRRQRILHRIGAVLHLNVGVAVR